MRPGREDDFHSMAFFYQIFRPRPRPIRIYQTGFNFREVGFSAATLAHFSTRRIRNDAIIFFLFLSTALRPARRFVLRVMQKAD
jgi:hypothetical protein